jgi:hypothetical protein
MEQIFSSTPDSDRIFDLLNFLLEGFPKEEIVFEA